MTAIASSVDFDSYYAIPNWTEPTASEAAHFNASFPSCAIDWSLPSMNDSPKIGAMLTVSSPIYSATSSPPNDDSNDIHHMKPFALVGDPDSKEARGFDNATATMMTRASQSATHTWSLVPSTKSYDNYGYGNNTPATSSTASASAAPCTAPSGTVWLSVGDAMDRSKAADMWECLHDWTAVPTVWANTETSVLSINASSSVMSAAALAAAKRNFKKVYVPGSLPSSTHNDLIAQRTMIPEVAIAGVGVASLPNDEVAPKKILLAEAPKKSGRGGGRKRCVLFPREMKTKEELAAIAASDTTPTGRPRKNSSAAAKMAKEKKMAAVAAGRVKGAVATATTATARKSGRRMRTRVNEVHHVAVTPAMMTTPVAVPCDVASAAAVTINEITSLASLDISPFDFEEVIDTRPGRAASTTSVAMAAGIGDMAASIVATKMVKQVSFETYLVDSAGNEVSLSHDGTLNGRSVVVCDEYDDR